MRGRRKRLVCDIGSRAVSGSVSAKRSFEDRSALRWLDGKRTIRGGYMALFTGPELAQLLTNNLVVEFFDGELAQQTGSHPAVYRGPGSISQDKDGQLQLKLFHSFSNGSDQVSDIRSTMAALNQLVPGKIVDSSHYYTFKAVDTKGRTWTAEQVSVKGQIQLGVATTGRVISGTLHAAKGEFKLPAQVAKITGKTDFHFVVPGAFGVPSTTSGTQQGERFDQVSYKIFDDLAVELKRYDNRLEIGLRGIQPEGGRDKAEVALQALGFSVGAYLRPVFERESKGDGITQTIRSRGAHWEQVRLGSPIMNNWLADSDNMLKFLSAFLANVSAPDSVLMGFWFRIYAAWISDYDIRALAVTTAIEGIVKAYYKDLRAPDKDFVKQINAAKPVVEALEIGERAKKRLVASLNDAKGASIKSALYALEKDHVLTGQQIQCWDDLRNRKVHADVQGHDTDESQKLLDDVHACVELFYRLVFNKIGYDGTFVQFAVRGWPRSASSAQEDSAEDESTDDDGQDSRTQIAT